MIYAVGQDPLCYAGTTVLKNKADLVDQGQLDAFEFEMFLTRSVEPFPTGNLDSFHYLSVHRHLFQDVYDWAGSIRSIRIGKAGNWFCFPEFIEPELAKLFEDLSKQDFFATRSSADFAVQAAGFLANLNAIHPFREGNGRCQISFLGLLASNAGLPFLAHRLDPVSTIDAMIASFSGKTGPLAMIIQNLVET